MITIKNQNFGIEIELTGITRVRAAEIIAEHFNTSGVRRSQDYYRSCYATDSKGREWRCMTDGSIICERKFNNRTIPASIDYSCEVVSPILQYDDIEDLQEIIRKLRGAGAFANSSTGIHIHIDGKNHTPDSIKRMLNFTIGRQDLVYEALNVTNERIDKWCKKTSQALFSEIKKIDSLTYDTLKSLWYSRSNDGYLGGDETYHYNNTRYHGINLHSYFTKGTIEFRLFNGTTHAGKIKAYIQFCLALSAWAESAKNDMYFKKITHYSKEQRGALMKRVLINRLGLKGAEFKTARHHLLGAFKTQEATAEAA